MYAISRSGSFDYVNFRILKIHIPGKLYEVEQDYSVEERDTMIVK